MATTSTPKDNENTREQTSVPVGYEAIEESE
jgi:hypothetical protein